MELKYLWHHISAKALQLRAGVEAQHTYIC